MAKDRDINDRITRRDEALDADARAASGVGPASDRLMLLDKTDYEIADGYPDPRGWDVVAGGRDGPKVGEVDQLLVDPGAQRVRYLVVKLDDDITRAKNRKVLVPVGVATLDDDDDKVIIPNRDAAFFATLPPFDEDRFNRDYENQLRERVAGAPMKVPANDRDYYEHDHFDEARLFGGRRERGAVAGEGEREARIPRVEEELAVGKRRVQAGEVEVRKTVETEHVKDEVPVMREEVDIERRPVEGRAASAANLKEGEIRVPVMAEEAVVQKRPVVKEEYIIRKRLVKDQQPVEADLRRERIDVQKQREDVRGRDNPNNPR